MPKMTDYVALWEKYQREDVLNISHQMCHLYHSQMCRIYHS